MLARRPNKRLPRLRGSCPLSRMRNPMQRLLHNDAAAASLLQGDFDKLLAQSGKFKESNTAMSESQSSITTLKADVQVLNEAVAGQSTSLTKLTDG